MKGLITLLMMGVCLSGCSETDGTAKSADEKSPTAAEDHVWQQQTDALQKARDAEQLLEDAQQQRKQQIDDALPPH